ncbi:MAG: amylo-alpha-1,6-glucosidase, partial [Clostridiales bacterium]|nr:amylo-alpha-1,6-glucosidase [Clostridiales bacterium]
MSNRFGKNDWKTIDEGLSRCYLLANGLGGFSSLSVAGSPAQNSQALFMACVKAPNQRVSLISWMLEEVTQDGKTVSLSSQSFVDFTKNLDGFTRLDSFSLDPFPRWTFKQGGVEIIKELAMEHGKNTLALRYVVRNQTDSEAALSITPQLQFAPKGEQPEPLQEYTTSQGLIQSAGIGLHFITNGECETFETKLVADAYFHKDATEGRKAVGVMASNHSIKLVVPPLANSELAVVYSLDALEQSSAQSLAQEIFANEAARLQSLEDKAGFECGIAKTLTRSADAFIVFRESTQGKTIIAGYPLFEDWGRDTMIALVGCCISTKRFEDAKSIFRTFIKYLKDGLMPNIFPEGESVPAYNTADAALLFIVAIQEYFNVSNDLSFVEEAWPAMAEIIEKYSSGTSYNIHEDSDGLIIAGSGFDQVTWMDVRIGDILPTPRHGKPVEINAYWNNCLEAMARFAGLLHKDGAEYSKKAEKAKESFNSKFWSDELSCLKDVITENGDPCESQIRCNQIWAVSLPSKILDTEREKKVVRKVYQELYTPCGLRSLSPSDPEFKPAYGGNMFSRDLSYHQGTVWGFPLGGFLLADLKANGDEAVERVKSRLQDLGPVLDEGCIGQIAEIYDGLVPAASRGCYAQAWSVGEVLRVFDKLR